ncbi:unnamed protein product [Cyclocybe aegerita]|uniref:carbonic anhydrase n=1 Tax=Cyclocybe aegerita TaxID=1973307 RepID=A0A8S0VZ20_CYCAE|nr:unnamed protein product [Cyclocybe aegerita]
MAVEVRQRRPRKVFTLMTASGAQRDYLVYRSASVIFHQYGSTPDTESYKKDTLEHQARHDGPTFNMKFFTVSARRLVVLLPLSAIAYAHAAGRERREDKKRCPAFPEIEGLFKGNQEYVKEMEEEHPGLLSQLANEGQKPPFVVFDCSDSRVSEQDAFSADPGTMFTAGNIANQFSESDSSANSVLSYAVGALKVKHVVIMGHYGCGGVSSAMVPFNATGASTADLTVQHWITPIREIYLTSTRVEIVEHRNKSLTGPISSPKLRDPAFRALVEENVKANVKKVADSLLIREQYASISPATNNCTSNSTAGEVYIHGLVYDIENGVVSDLRVSVGPPGRVVPPSPFPGANTKKKN